jgi:hypothetical protein
MGRGTDRKKRKPRAPKTHCKKGHEMTEANTYRISTRPNDRICWTCKRANLKSSWSHRSEASKEKHRAYQRLRDKLRPRKNPEETHALRSKRQKEAWSRRGRMSPRQIRLSKALSQQRYRQNNPTYRIKNIENYKRKNYDKYKAGRLLRVAVQRGHIQKPKHCTNCDRPCNPEGHHRDYSKPYEVRWLCRKCHCLAHGRELLISMGAG